MKTPFNTKKSLQNWFGDRGEPIEKSWVHDWFVKGNLLYISWTDETPYHLTPVQPHDCCIVNWKSMYFEWEDYGFFDQLKGCE